MGCGTIRRFEDVKAWQLGRELVSRIYMMTQKVGFNRDIGLREQARRAAISIMLNIAEGFGRGTDKEFRQFLIQAHGSVAEVQCAFYIALDQKYISRTDFDSLYNSLEELSKMLMSFAKYLGNAKSSRRSSTPDSKTLDSKTHK
jgi:four helix bundle protein